LAAGLIKPQHEICVICVICGYLLFLSAVVLERPSARLKEPGMPYLSIQTNKELEEKEQSRLLAEASKIVAAKLNKPEKYVMVAWTAVPKMIFDNDPNGAAFLELQSIGIPEASRQELAAALAKCAAQFLGIDADRVYLVMKDIPAKYWAQGEQTFG
jgi:phenylpyruvate tautomerase PptA (4-oxalocrotonate tautomerase family)